VTVVAVKRAKLLLIAQAQIRETMLLPEQVKRDREETMALFVG